MCWGRSRGAASSAAAPSLLAGGAALHRQLQPLSQLCPWVAPTLPTADNGFTAAKLGCGEGGCGACTVMVSSAEPDGSLYHRSINACLCPLYAVEGMHVVTAEGELTFRLASREVRGCC